MANAVLILGLCLLLGAAGILLYAGPDRAASVPAASVPAAPLSVAPLATPNPTETAPLDTPQATPTALPLTSPTPTPEPEPTAQSYWLSFAGDCTLGSEQGNYGEPGTFVAVVGDDYAYPFSAVRTIFEQDDLTLVNLEGALTDSQAASDKLFRFRGPADYAKILTSGSVECVNLANNHTHDYGDGGYEDTKAALDAQGVPYVEHEGTLLYTTARGLNVGLFAASFYTTQSAVQSGIDALRAQGAQVVVCVFHMGTEGSYHPTDRQVQTAHMAVDCGADIVVEHHPHVLQPMETYNGKPIFYSLGNFSFGGNRSPADRDTVILQQEVVVEPDGAVRLGATVPIPCRLSGHDAYNDFQPAPYGVDDPGYARVLSKLSGTYAGADLSVDYRGN